MDDPVLVARLARRVRGWVPELPIIARARDTDHAAQLYRAGVTDAVPETLEASLQLAEAVLVDIGAPMGPVIASIHEKRAELRVEIMAEAETGDAAARSDGGGCEILSLGSGLEPEHACHIGPVVGIVARWRCPSCTMTSRKSNGETPSRQATLTPSWLGFDRRLWCV